MSWNWPNEEHSSSDEHQRDFFVRYEYLHKRRRERQRREESPYCDISWECGSEPILFGQKNQSSFGLRIENDNHETQTPNIRMGIYSEDISSIQRDTPRDIVELGHQKRKGHGFQKTFRPLASSTPKSQAPIRSIIESQVSQKLQRVAVEASISSEVSEDLMQDQNVILSLAHPEEGAVLQPQQEKEGEEIIFLPKKKSVEIYFRSPVAQSQKGCETSNQSPKSTEGENLKDVYSLDICTLIPQILVTSYSNSSKFDQIGDSPVIFNHVHETSKQKRFLGIIEQIVLDTICAINQEHKIDPKILSFYSQRMDVR